MFFINYRKVWKKIREVFFVYFFFLEFDINLEGEVMKMYIFFVDYIFRFVILGEVVLIVFVKININIKEF